MERKIYLYDRGFWVLFRMLGIFAAALSLFLTLCFIMWIREWAFLLAILAGIVATVALLMHSRCTKRQYVVLADGRLTVGEAFGQVEKTFPLDAFPYAYLYTDAKVLGNRCAEQKTADGGANPRAVPAESGEQAE